MQKPLTAIICVAVAGALLTATPAQGVVAECAGSDAPAGSITLEEYDTAILCLLNAERADAGLVPLTDNADLSKAARRHSRSMKVHSRFAHESLRGAAFWKRIGRTGYKTGASRWSVGENIAWGAGGLGTPAAIVAGWMGSAIHRENILNTSFREIGIGSVHGSPILSTRRRGITITTDFGWRS